MKFTLINTHDLFRIALYEDVDNGELYEVSYYLDDDEPERSRDALAEAAFAKMRKAGRAYRQSLN